MQVLSRAVLKMGQEASAHVSKLQELSHTYHHIEGKIPGGKIAEKSLEIRSEKYLEQFVECLSNIDQKHRY